MSEPLVTPTDLAMSPRQVGPDALLTIHETDENLITLDVTHLQGEEFDEDGAPHQKMVARLSLSD